MELTNVCAKLAKALELVHCHDRVTDLVERCLVLVKVQELVHGVFHDRVTGLV